YVESSIGFAYRPVENDRLNALFGYTFLYDLPGTDQVNANGETDGPRQISHVLSADGIWQANKYVSLGAKYGFRIGQVETDRDSGDFEDSSAHLAIARADLHVLKSWDALVEGRVLWSPTAETTDYGALAALYRHVGSNLKAGVGYNFGRFSDDLTDLTQDDQGAFLNIVGKF
ncbi:MAG: TonB-dependent receptor, partial [Pseudomonadota bacterium]